jgi:hypothetical protein
MAIALPLTDPNLVSCIEHFHFPFDLSLPGIFGVERYSQIAETLRKGERIQ